MPRVTMGWRDRRQRRKERSASSVTSVYANVSNARGVVAVSLAPNGQYRVTVSTPEADNVLIDEGTL